MKDALYTTDILRLAADIPRLTRLSDADYSVTKVSPICGSRVKVDVRIENGQVIDYGQEVRACALGQASAAIMGAAAVGLDLTHFETLDAALADFLKGNGPALDAPFEDTQVFGPAKDYKSRHASILLPFQAMADIARQAANAEPVAEKA
ncbi:MAG: iron-sulfur cluster assembly scaffold protein [Pseudomonadota bacterium]